MVATKGAFPGGHWKNEPDADVPVELGKAGSRYPKPDNKYIFDKLNSVFLSGNATRDDAPNHIRIQERVPREVAQTWVSMCPAQVYEIPEEQLTSGAETVDVHVTPSNCVQCGAITAKGGRLTLPGGRGRPPSTCKPSSDRSRRSRTSSGLLSLSARFSVRPPPGPEAATKAATSRASLPWRRFAGMLPLRRPPIRIAVRTSLSVSGMSPRFGPI